MAPAIDPALKAKRIAEDIDMMNSPGRWPDLVLHLKTQPWVKPQEFGIMMRGWPTPCIVYLKANDDPVRALGETETFASLEELAERWSVD